MSVYKPNDFCLCRHISITGNKEIMSRIITMLEKFVFTDKLANN